MSGPIVRKYGFPNFEQIFGKRELEHGAEETKESVKQEGNTEAEAKKPSQKPVVKSS